MTIRIMLAHYKSKLAIICKIFHDIVNVLTAFALQI